MSAYVALAAGIPTAGWAATTAILSRRLATARRDPLTGLHGRAAFTARARNLTANGTTLVLLIDLDGFKAVNDRYGHAAGDAILARTARRLNAAVGDKGIAARLGGDEFAAAMPCHSRAAAARYLDGLHDLLVEPTLYGVRQLLVGASVGGHIATPGVALSAALHAADVAMYEAKRSGGGWQLAGSPVEAYRGTPGRWRRNGPQQLGDDQPAPEDPDPTRGHGGTQK